MPCAGASPLGDCVRHGWTEVCAKGHAFLLLSAVGAGPATRPSPPTPSPPDTHTLDERAVEGDRDSLLSGFRSRSGRLQDRNWQELFGWSPESASALPDEPSQGGGGARGPAPACAERRAGSGPLPGVPQGAGRPGPGTLHSVLQGPG